MEKVDVPAALQRYEDALEAEVRSLLAERQGPLYEMMRYHLGAGQNHPSRGKHLRPTLALLSCEAVGGDWKRALPGAAALELLHNFSLIHDDIQDESPTRRGQPTLWWKWGVTQAINAGDGMHALARLALLGLEALDTPAPTIIACVRLLDEACLALCEGQYLDIYFQGCDQVTIADYMEMISRKTATLFGSSLEMGALLGGASPDLIARFRSAGHHLGLSYQIRDDALDLWGGQAIGKVHATDVRNKKKTLPVVYALEQDGTSPAERLRELYRQPVLSAEDIDEAIRLLEDLQAREFCVREAEKYQAAALAELEVVAAVAQPLTELKAIATFLIDRDF